MSHYRELLVGCYGHVLAIARRPWVKSAWKGHLLWAPHRSRTSANGGPTQNTHGAGMVDTYMHTHADIYIYIYIICI